MAQLKNIIRIEFDELNAQMWIFDWKPVNKILVDINFSNIIFKSHILKKMKDTTKNPNYIPTKIIRPQFVRPNIHMTARSRRNLNFSHTPAHIRHVCTIAIYKYVKSYFNNACLQVFAEKFIYLYDPVVVRVL